MQRSPNLSSTAASNPVTCLHTHMFFFSSRRRHTILQGDWSSDVCSSDLARNKKRIVVGAAHHFEKREFMLAAGIGKSCAHLGRAIRRSVGIEQFRLNRNLAFRDRKSVV